MQAAPARYVSVSELYSTDEVELLLDEIRDLEPTSCRGEDVQDFEIAGSGLGSALGGGGGGGGGRSPAGTELTERSWDSHAHYSRAPPRRARALAPLYCRAAHLASLTGAATALVVVCSVCTCGCVWAVSGPHVRRLPLAARAQLLLLGAVSAALLHSLLLLLHITRLRDLLPLRWDLLAMWSGVWSGLSLGVGGALTLHAVLGPAYRLAPPHAQRLLLAAAGLGLIGACASFVIVGWVLRACCGALHAAGGAGAGGAGMGGAGGEAGAYRAVPSAPPDAVPSTSRDDPL